jgi:hypothetical protein
MGEATEAENPKRWMVRRLPICECVTGRAAAEAQQEALVLPPEVPEGAPGPLVPQQVAPAPLEVQQGPREQPQGPLPRRSALQEAGHDECRRRRSAGLLAGTRPQEERLEGARPQG